MVKWRSARNQFLLTLLVATVVSIGLFAYGALRHHRQAYAYHGPCTHITLQTNPMV